MGPTREDHTTLDIYTISNGKVIRLTNKDNRLDKIGDTFEIVTEGTTEDTIKNLPKKLDLKQIEWKPTQWYTTSPEKQKEVAKKKFDI